MYVVWIYPYTFEPRSTSAWMPSAQRKPIKRVFKRKSERDAYLQAVEDIDVNIEVISFYDEFYNLSVEHDKKIGNRRPGDR